MLKAAAENGGMRRVNERENVRWINKKEARKGKSEEDEKKRRRREMGKEKETRKEREGDEKKEKETRASRLYSIE